MKSKTRMKYKFSMTGFFWGCLASVFYALGGVFTWWRDSIPSPVVVLIGISSFLGPAFCLIAPGATNRPVSVTRYFVWGLFSVAGGFCFLLARAWCSVSYIGGPPPPWPVFSTYGILTLSAAVICLIIGTLISGIPREWDIKWVAPMAAGIAVLVISAFLKLVFPFKRYAYIQIWEFVTILIAGPGLCSLAWLPFDLLKKEIHTKGNIDKQLKGAGDQGL